MSKKEDALKLYYEKNFMNHGDFYRVPYEFLYAEEVDVFRKSFGFAVFNLRYRISLFLEDLTEKLFN